MNIELHRTLLQRACEEQHIPLHMRDGLIEFICTGRPVGHFLSAVLDNDLKEACARADEVNAHHLFNYGSFLYNHAPVACWGSEKKRIAWIERRGLEGVLSEAK